MAKVAIVGAGLSGLVAAIVLAQRGIEATVFEQADQLGEVGAGISLAPNATRILEAMGLNSQLALLADEPWANQTFHYHGMEMLVDIRREDARSLFGAPYLQLHRADLHRAFVECLEGIAPDTVKLGRKLTGVEDLGSGIKLSFADGSVEHADVVIGADGVHSVVRGQLFEDSSPDFLGQVAYRGLVDRKALDGEWPIDRSRNLVGPGAVFLTYPIRKGAIINFVGLKRTQEWVGEGWSTKATKEELYSAFEDWHPCVRQIIENTDEASLYKWGLFGREPLASYVAGRALLIGDAAHPMLPFLGMGAAMAIEDGAVIGRCLSEIEDVDLAIARYDALRGDRTRMVQSASRDAGVALQGLDPNLLRKGVITNEDKLGLFPYDAMQMPLNGEEEIALK